MNPLESLLVARIEKNGSLSFAEYMEAALYHPRHGYYSGRARRVGWSGDYVTSSEVDPSFGRLWARAFERLWRDSARPQRFTVAEIGPGEGGFARAVLDASAGDFGDALHLVLVERGRLRPGARQRLMRHPRVERAPSIDAAGDVDVVFANEVLDNLPVHVVRRREGSYLEVRVGVKDGRLVEVDEPLEDAALVERVGALHIEDGARAEISPAAEALVADAATAAHAAAIFIDYGYRERDYARRRAGTLVCYSSAGADDRVLESPGRKDVTAHVNWDAVRRVLESRSLEVRGPLSQADVLRSLGLSEMDDELRAEHRRALTAGDGAAAVRALSRRSALGVLTDPGGLGSLDVVAGVRAGTALLQDKERGPAAAGPPPNP